MKVTKLNPPVMSSWLEDNQRRLDASPYAVENLAQ